jgi:hypothetical protein
MAELRMIRFTLRVLGRSLRWVAPAMVGALWFLLVLSNPGPVRSNAVAFFPLLAIVGCWLAVLTGNLDDDGHRELCTAIVGSPRRLLIDRAAAAAIVTAVVAAAAAVAAIAFGSPHSFAWPTAVAVLALELAGGAIGVGIGAVLHRPLVRHLGITVLGATGALVSAIATPPVTSRLRLVYNGQNAAAYVLLAAATLAACGLTAIAAQAVGRFAR